LTDSLFAAIVEKIEQSVGQTTKESTMSWRLEALSWYLEALKKYAVFSRRARRKEFWMFFFINLLISVVLIAIDSLIGTFSPQTGFGLLQGLYSLAVLIPSIAVTVRRLHDTGRTGWWILISLVPFVGGIVLLIFMLLDSQAGVNQYGPNPKAGYSASRLTRRSV
jgi:uncharacterized membrane protein YhaH (DUF805 family)